MYLVYTSVPMSIWLIIWWYLYGVTLLLRLARKKSLLNDGEIPGSWANKWGDPRWPWNSRKEGRRFFIMGTGWWFQPIWKILVSWNDYSQYMEKKMFKTTNQGKIGKVYNCHVFLILNVRNSWKEKNATKQSQVPMIQAVQTHELSQKNMNKLSNIH